MFAILPQKSLWYNDLGSVRRELGAAPNRPKGGMP